MSKHTNQKPHTCGECAKSFTRIDNLRRHYKIEHPDAGPSITLEGLQPKADGKSSSQPRSFTLEDKVCEKSIRQDGGYPSDARKLNKLSTMKDDAQNPIRMAQDDPTKGFDDSGLYDEALVWKPSTSTSL